MHGERETGKNKHTRKQQLNQQETNKYVMIMSYTDKLKKWFKLNFRPPVVQHKKSLPFI